MPKLTWKRRSTTRVSRRRGTTKSARLACESLEPRYVLSTHSLVNFASYSRPLADGDGVSGAAVLDANLDGRPDLLLSTFSLNDEVAPGKTLIGFNTQDGALQFSDMGSNQRVHWGSISTGDLGYGSSHPEVILDAGRVVSFGAGNTWRQVDRYDVPNTFAAVAITDFDNDGRSDLLAVAAAANAVSISRQLPGGTFSSLVTTSYGTASSSGFVVHFDNDSFADLLVMRVESFPLPGQTFSPLTVELWRGTSTGQFVFDSTLATGLSGLLAGAADVNGDGRKDLLFQTGNGSVLSVYLQNASRGLTKVQDITVSTTLQDNSYFQTVAPLDYNGDGRADLAIWTWEGIKLYTAGSDGRFSFAGSRTDVRPTYFMVTGDFDGNGREELVVPAYNQGRVFVDIYKVLPLAATPGVPTGVTGTAGNGQVSLSWTTPASNGGAAITDYVIQYSSNAGSTWTTFNDGVSTWTSTTVTGLTNGTGYTFRVAAKNSAGQGGYSTASSTVTPKAPVAAPGAPTNVTGSSGNGQVSLTWTAPAFNGGAAITDYVIQYSANAGSTWRTFNDGISTATSTVVTGLTNGTRYTFRVAAKNSAGQGSYSTASSTVTPAGPVVPPGSPTNVTGTAGNGQVSLTWTAPSSNGGAATDYVIEYSANAGSTWTTFSDGVSTATSTVVTGLTNGIGYVFRVAAKNEAGRGGFSTASSTVTPKAPVAAPGAPTNLTGTAGNGQVSLTWTAPASNGGSAITDYVIQYSSNAGSTWTTFNDAVATATSTTVTGLTNGTGYTFRVAAKNTAGQGGYSAASTTATPVAATVAPGAPTNVTATPGNSEVRLSWKPPASHGSAAITNYVLQRSVDNGNTWATINRAASPATFAIVTGLTNGASYIFRVAAENRERSGVYSANSNSVAPGSQHLFAPLVGGVSRIVSPGVPGSPIRLVDDWQPIASAGLSASSPSVFVVARTYGAGRIVALGHAGILRSLDIYDNKQFVENTLAWLSPTRLTDIRFTSGHREWVNGSIINALRTSFDGQGFDVAEMGFPVSSQSLGSADVLVVNEAWGQFSAAELEALDAYVAAGGGLLLVGVGWSWEPYNPGLSLAQYPMNAVGATFGVRWDSLTISHPENDAPEISSVVFSDFFPNAASLPANPRSLAATARDERVELRWEPSVSDGGSSITDYLIQYSSNAGSTWTTFNDGVSSWTSATVTGLTNGTEYVFRVAAVTNAGTGRYSRISEPVTPLPPANTEIESRGSVLLTYDRLGRIYAGKTPVTNGGSTIDYHAMNASGWQAIAAEPIDGVNTLVWRHSSGNLHFWKLSESWTVMWSEGWQAPGSPEYFATETSFGMDFDNDGTIGSPFTVIESIGDATLAFDVDGRLYVGNTLVTLGQAAVNYHSMNALGWRAVAAEAIDGVNTIVWEHATGNLHLWRLSDSWAHIRSEGWQAPGSLEYFATESALGMDFNADGAIGAPFTTIESVGAADLGYDGAGQLYAGGTLVTLGGKPVNYTAMTESGWQPLAAEPINGINTLAWRHASGNLHFWRLSEGWAVVSSDGWQGPRSPDYHATEIAFAMDFNGDGQIGAPWVTIEAIGSTTLSRDSSGRLYASNSLITLGGKSVDFNAMTAAGWRAVAAEAVNGINTLVWRHESGNLHFWRLSATWAHISSDGWEAPGSRAARASERAFGMDLNGNGTADG